MNPNFLETPKKILICQTAFIGDVILATSLIEKLHYHFPEAQIDFLVRKGNQGLLEGHPHLRQVLVWDKKQGKYRNIAQLISEIRGISYDWVVNLQRYATTGFLTAFSGAKRKIGFDKNPLSFLFTDTAPHQFEGLHEIARNTALVATFTTDEVFQPRLYPSDNDYQQASQLASGPYITLSPTSVWFTKEFPKEKWVEFINETEFWGDIFLLGAPSDKELFEEMIAHTNKKNIHNLAGLPFLASAALAEGALLNYVNDSAMMHIASAMNAPTCAIYCSTSPIFGFSPLASFSKIIEIPEQLACKPCGTHGYRACPEGHFKCGFDIRISQLQKALKEAEAHQKNM